MSELDLHAFRAAYGAFLRPGRILLTGHSHQAWPDCVRDALVRTFDDAARFADDKWGEAVFPVVDRVGRRVLERFGFDASDPIAFGRSTHELVFRLMSSFPALFAGASRTTDGPSRRLRVVTTSGEFHSLDRQLTRLEEEGVEVTWVPATPRDGLAGRVARAIGPGTDLVAISAVLFEDSCVVEDLERVISRAKEVGASVLVDAYHAFNVVPLAWGAGRDHVFAVAGGYKYAEFGEGICWLRLPPQAASSLRPAYTGWFADFDSLDGPRRHASTSADAPVAPVGYASGSARFAGATFDPTPFYRADAVLDHFDRFALGVEQLRAISLRQTSRIIERLERAGAEVVTPLAAAKRGGFVAVRVESAASVVAALRERGVFVDARGDLLRLGPAPYLLDDEIDAGVDAAVEALSRVRSKEPT